MNNFSFQTLLSKKARFINGEDISPPKMSGFAAQIENAFKVIQNFLGNGTDYLVPNGSDLSDRSVLFNLSSAIGSGDKIYKPVNKIYSNEQLWKKNLASNSTNAAYDPATDVLTLKAGHTLTITTSIAGGNKVSIYYKTTSSTCTIDRAPAAQAVLPASATDYTWALLDINSASSSEGTSIVVTAVVNDILIKSLIISNAPHNGITSNATVKINGGQTPNDYAVFNVGYCIPLTNKSYFRVATPCKHALADAITPCLNKTCDYCIGNTYDADGSPVCLNAQRTYEASTLEKKTIQSPILTEVVPYGAKLMPYKLHQIALADNALPANSLALYDIENNTSPIFNNIQFNTASPSRGDIVWVDDTAGISDITNNKKYLVLNSAYGLSDFMWDIAGFTKGF